MTNIRPWHHRSAVLAIIVTITSLGMICSPLASTAATAVMTSSPTSATAQTTPCPETQNATRCDADTDRIADQLERQLCGTATCATGTEDSDGDGVPDWVEFTACRTTTCADPHIDTDGNGIPDYISEVICGTATCTDGLETLNPHGVQQWISVLICGDITCATGIEDLNGDGIPDAQQLLKRYLDLKAAREAAEAARLRALAQTGLTVVLPLGTGLLVTAGGVALLVAWRRRRLAALSAGATDRNLDDHDRSLTKAGE